MGQKKLSVYGNLVSTANNKVEHLYLVIDQNSIVFVVKNTLVNEFVAIEHFKSTDDQTGWSQLIGFLQNNSTLIHSVYNKIYFVLNLPRMLLSKEHTVEDNLQYANELDLVFGKKQDEEIYTSLIDAKYNLVYSVPDELSALLSRTFPTGKWQHYAQFLIQNAGNSELQLTIFDQHIIVQIKDQGQIKFLNYYSLGGKDQNIYNILNACIQVGVDTNLLHLKLSGCAAPSANFVNALIPYFKSFETTAIADTGIGLELNKAYPNFSYAPYFIF
jgi:Protein of unknown function (DUF3822)